MKNQRTAKIILYALLGCILLFIWGNSCLPVTQSAAASGTVERLLKPLLSLIVQEGTDTSNLVRKTAHFCEFGALGVALGLLLWRKPKPTPFEISYAFFFGVVVAVVDESIQLVSAGRGAQIQDVLLDTSGAATGLLLCELVMLLLRSFRSKPQDK